MTIDEFNQLDESTKKVLIFEANKVAEHEDDAAKFQLFKIENFFVETKTSLTNIYKRTLATYKQQDLPRAYSSRLV